MLLRSATPDDIVAIAAIHADNWRREYRGIYSDAFLDGGVDADRLELWTGRLTRPLSNERTTAVEADGQVVAFVRLLVDDDPEWGSHVSNLHVDHRWRRRGIGTHLLDHAARTALELGAHPMLHLWVLAENHEAQHFYDALGGERLDTRTEPGRDGGAVVQQRYLWRDPHTLLVG